MIRSPMNPKLVLVIARPSTYMENLLGRLRDAACWVELATNSADGARVAAHLNPEIVVLEDGMPDGTPVELMLRIRSVVSAEKPPVFLLAMSGEPLCTTPDVVDQPGTGNGVVRVVDQIVGFLSSTNGETTEPEQIHCHGLILDRARHRVSVDGEPLHLTPTEFKLLWQLASRPGYVLSRSKLARVCKGSESAVQARTIDAHIKSIRRKLSDRSRLIETVHGLGYRFQELEATVS